MDDIIYEQDYRRKQGETDAETQRSIEIFYQALSGGFFSDYKAAMDAIPKVIVQKDRENYEYLLSRCDEAAKQNHWKVRGVVDYHRWESRIELVMPLAEFDEGDELELLREIAERAATVTFDTVEDGCIRLHIMINYFEELMTEEHRAYLEYEALTNDGRLAGMVGIPPLSPEMEDIVARMNALLDRFENETEFDRTTVFKALLDRMPKEDIGEQTFERMIELGEKLLEATLEGQDSI